MLIQKTKSIQLMLVSLVILSSCTGNIFSREISIDYTPVLEKLKIGEKTTQINLKNTYFNNDNYFVTNMSNVFAWETSKLIPEPINIDIKRYIGDDLIEKIYISSGNKYLLTQSGKVFAWGENDNGTLGIGRGSEEVNNPTQLSFAGITLNETIIDLFFYDWFSSSGGFAITSNGRVFGWGENSGGSLGDGTKIDSLTPKLINFPNLQSNEKITKIVPHDSRTYAISNLGKAWAWGINWSSHYGYMLGNSSTSDSTRPRLISYENLNQGEYFIDIKTQPGQVHAITNQGRLFAWGNNKNWQLGVSQGDGHRTSDIQLPTLVGHDSLNQDLLTKNEKIIDVFYGYTLLDNISFLLTDKGRLFMWPTKWFNEIPDIYGQVNIPDLSSNDQIVKLSVGFEHYIALSKNGRIFSSGNSGRNTNGQRGHDRTSNSTRETAEVITVPGLENNEKIIDVIASIYGSMALTSEGRIFVWGDNDNGQLGHENKESIRIPLLVDSTLRKINYNQSIYSFSKFKVGEIPELVAPNINNYNFHKWYIDEQLQIEFNANDFDDYKESSVRLFARYFPV
jgi:alpha-tubulin suppressor-like RCC1 family protein